MKKLNVGVLMGGKSIEREVSFNSGRTVCDHLDATRYNIIPLFQDADGTIYQLPWHFLHRGKISDFQYRLAEEAPVIAWDNLPGMIDFMYIAMHGQFAEDGTLQGILELLNIPYLGSDVFVSALCINKYMQKKFMQMHGITTPKEVMLTPARVAAFAEHRTAILQEMQNKNIQFPCIVKPSNEGSSLGISVAHAEQELEAAVRTACYTSPERPQMVLIEEKITGMEFSCVTITDYKNNTLMPLPPTEIELDPGTEFHDYEQKYMPGRTTKYTPARCSATVIQKIQDACVATMRALGITNISRIDGFVTADEKIVIVDPNTISGMGPASFVFRQAAEVGMSHAALINHLIETELHQYGMLNALIKQEQESATMHAQPKLRVAVIFGGQSHEKEVSFESGRNVVYKLSSQKYDVTPLFLAQNGQLYKVDHQQLTKNSTSEIARTLLAENNIAWNDLPALCDFVFLGLHGGIGENGVVQGTLEMLGLPYNGSSVLASALCMHKYNVNQFLRAQGFDVPNSLLITKEEWQTDKAAAVASIVAQLGSAIIIKPADDGCSSMVYKTSSAQEITELLTIIFNDGKQFAMAEEYIEGTELTVGVLGNETVHVLPPSQTIKGASILSLQEKFLPGAGSNITPALLTPSARSLVQKTIGDAYQTIGCSGYARIDCFYQSAGISRTGAERVIILEINTLPALTPATCLFHQAAEVGIRPMELIDMIVQFGLEKWQPTSTNSAYKNKAASDKAIL